MLIEVLSDQHLNLQKGPNGSRGMDNYDLLPRPYGLGEALVVAGDVGAWEHDTKPYLDKLRADFGVPIIFVPGNHEYEGAGLTMNHAFTHDDPDIHILQFGESVDIGKVRFIGATLWTSLEDDNDTRYYAKEFHDFRHLKSQVDPGRYVSVAEYRQQFEKELAALAAACQQAHRDAMQPAVITHHAPFLSSMAVRFIGSSMNRFFVNDLSSRMDLFEGKLPVLWIHGHTHNPADYVQWVNLQSIHVVNEPCGYAHERQGESRRWRILEI